MTHLSFSAVANQAYNSSEINIAPPGQPSSVYTTLNNQDVNSNHQYKSLKKPDEDLGSGEYADPEKYTEPPPMLPQRNTSNDDEDEDYISQGTPEPTSDEGRNYFTLEPPSPSGDCVKKPSQISPADESQDGPAGDYVSLDQASPNGAPSSDYVSVDSPDQASPDMAPSSDYVSVDSPDKPIPNRAPPSDMSADDADKPVTKARDMDIAEDSDTEHEISSDYMQV